jgi:3D-(3,5/4)-trihydroxycyclohexane-1,2-dione acylhydrolase (decyclizing)
VRVQRPVVVSCRVHHSTWTEAGAWWETGVPEYLSGREAYDDAKQRQVRWL